MDVTKDSPTKTALAPAFLTLSMSTYELIPLSLTIILSLGISLRYYLLDRGLGGGDENEVLMMYVDKPLLYILTTFADNYHHVFHTILLHFMAKFFGLDNEYAIRSPAFISAIICLWLVYKLAYHLFADRIIAQISLLIIVFGIYTANVCARSHKVPSTTLGIKYR